MKNYKKHIDTFIREKAGRNAQMPPSHVWENLDKQLDGLNSSKPPVSYRWMRSFGIISLVLLLSASVVMKLVGNSRTENNQTANSRSQDNNLPATNNITAGHGTAKTTAPTTPATQTPAAQTNIAQTIAATENTTTAQPANNNTQPANNTTTSTTTASTIKITRQPSTADAGKNSKEEMYAANNKIPQTKTGHHHTTTNTARNRSTPTQPINNYAANNATGNNNINNTPNSAPANSTITANQSANTGTVQNNQAPQPATAATNYAAAPANETNKTSRLQPANDQLSENKQTKPLPITTKTENISKPITKKHKKGMSVPATRWEEGIKAGYENGFNSYAASKYALAPYVQYNISAKVSLLVQPTAKYAQLTTHNVGNTQPYYIANDDGTVTQNGNSTFNPQNNTYTTNYTFSQTHDSISKSNVARGTYMEFELPILAKYYIARQLSVYAGINLIYTQLPGITEHTYEQDGILKTVDFATVTPALPTTLPLSPNVSYTGTPFANYNGPLYQSSATGKFHIGYMVGFTYQYGKRWLLDALVQQSPVSSNVIGGYNINAPLSAFYWRTSVGYKFINYHKDKLFGRKDTGRGD